MDLNGTLTFPPFLGPCNATTTRALTESGVCDCHEGFSGIHCDEVMAWWVTMERARSVLGVMLLLLLCFWAVLKIVHSFRFEIWRSLWQLVPVSTLIVLVGLLVRVASLPIQPRAYGPMVLLQTAEESPYRAMLLAYGILHGTAVAIVAASFNLLIGFWLDVTSRVRSQITRRTKVASIVLAVAMAIVSAATLVATVILEDATIAQVPIVISTFLDTLIVTGIIVYLTAPCCGTTQKILGAPVSDATMKTRRRWVYMRRCLFSALAFWYLYVLTASLVGPLTAMPGMASYRVVLSYVTMLGELGFYTSVMLIIDHRGGPLRLCDEMMRGKARAILHTRPTSTHESGPPDASKTAAISSKTMSSKGRVTKDTDEEDAVFSEVHVESGEQ